MFAGGYFAVAACTFVFHVVGAVGVRRQVLMSLFAAVCFARHGCLLLLLLLVVLELLLLLVVVLRLLPVFVLVCCFMFGQVSMLLLLFAAAVVAVVVNVFGAGITIIGVVVSAVRVATISRLQKKKRNNLREYLSDTYTSYACTMRIFFHIFPFPPVLLSFSPWLSLRNELSLCSSRGAGQYHAYSPRKFLSGS